jgi:predicted MPP superfamily phosphohydrolase
MLKKDLIKRFIHIKREMDIMEKELGLIIDSKGTEKTLKVKPYTEALMSKDLDPKRFTKYFAFPDLHYPDHNETALKNTLEFVKDFRPDVFVIEGDFVNFTLAGKYVVVGGYDVSIGDEIRGAREKLKEIVEVVRTANPKARILFLEGNHEQRLGKYLARNADALQDLTDEEGDNILTVPHLFGLKEMNIEWYSYDQIHKEDGVIFEHGNQVRQKSGYTANGMLDKRGRSGFSAHTHRLCLIVRNQGGDIKFWTEGGSLCNLNPSPNYVVEPDWVNGFAYAVFDKQEKIMHPQTVLIQNDHFYANGKIY